MWAYATSCGASTGRHGPTTAHLLTPIYLAALAGLVFNDEVLKQAFPGLIKGKLSDFAGLFTFAVFLSVVIRRRIPAIHATIAVAFTVWKSAVRSRDRGLERRDAVSHRARRRPLGSARAVGAAALDGLPTAPMVGDRSPRGANRDRGGDFSRRIHGDEHCSKLRQYRDWQ